MKHPVHMTIGELRAAIRGLTDSAYTTPQEALRHFQTRGEDAVWPGFSDNENQALRIQLAALIAACETEAIAPEQALDLRVAA